MPDTDLSDRLHLNRVSQWTEIATVRVFLWTDSPVTDWAKPATALNWVLGSLMHFQTEGPLNYFFENRVNFVLGKKSRKDHTLIPPSLLIFLQGIRFFYN